jgi:hypothetical protein
MAVSVSDVGIPEGYILCRQCAPHPRHDGPCGRMDVVRGGGHDKQCKCGETPRTVNAAEKSPPGKATSR